MHALVRVEPAVEVVWRAFELRPEPVPSLDPKGDYLQSAWKRSVYPLAERLRVKMRLPPLQPRSRLAHQAAHWARGQGRFEDYNATVFRAFFERGEDIGDMGILTGLAAELGLEGDALRNALERREFEQGVLEDERTAEALGLRGVPAFVANREAALSGVQPVDSLRKLIEQVRA